MGPNQIYKLLHSKKTIKQKDYLRNSRKYSANDATTKRLICKIYKHYTAQHKNKNQTNRNQKWREGPHRHFFQRRHTNGQQPYENMFNIVNY